MSAVSDKAEASMRRRGAAADLLERFRRSDAGAITVELAATAIVLVALAIGAYDFGRMGAVQAQLISAARAGAQYGMQSQSASGEFGQIIAAARADAGDTEENLEVDARQYCSCAGGAETACTGTCADGKYPPMYLEITVAGDFRTLFAYPGLPQTIPLSAESVTRVR